MGLAATNLKTAMKLKVYEWDFVRRPQRIRKLSITPQPAAAIFSFRTVQPTVPIIEIFRNLTGNPDNDMKPDNLVATAFNFVDAMLGNLFTEHNARLTGLPQDTPFHYRVTATDGKFPSAVIVGSFMTARRDLSVFIRDVQMFNDGDPGAKASGELSFYFGFYLDRAYDTERRYDANIESGELRDYPLGKGATYNATSVPESFAVFVRGVEYDYYWGYSDRGEWFFPGTLRDSLMFGENDDEVFAEAMQSFDMPQAPGNYDLGLLLDSGPRGIHYRINGRVVVDVLPPREAPVVPFEGLLDIEGFEDLEKFKRLALTGAGSRGGIRGGGKLHAFAMGPESALYMKRPEEDWAKLDDGAGLSDRCACDLTADIVCDDHDRIHVLTMRAGALRHASMPVKGRGEPPRFRPIGEGLQRQPTVVSVEDGTAYVFVRDVEGALKVAALTGSERGRWVDLGGNFAAPVSTHVSRREIEIFGVTAEGQPIGGRWRIGSSKRPEWAVLGRGLGDTRLRHLDVLIEHDRIHLLALAEDRRLLTLTRSDQSWNGSWKDSGSLDAFFFMPPANPPKVSKVKARKVNGTARPIARRRKAEEGARLQA